MDRRARRQLTVRAAAATTAASARHITVRAAAAAPSAVDGQACRAAAGNSTEARRWRAQRGTRRRRRRGRRERVDDGARARTADGAWLVLRAVVWEREGVGTCERMQAGCSKLRVWERVSGCRQSVLS
eukprot:362176-Chlamydomonas_euryale.AAC.4